MRSLGVSSFLSATVAGRLKFASNEEDPRLQGVFFKWLFFERRLSYRQEWLVDLGAIPRNLTRASPCTADRRVFVFRVPLDCRGSGTTLV